MKEFLGLEKESPICHRQTQVPSAKKVCPGNSVQKLLTNSAPLSQRRLHLERARQVVRFWRRTARSAASRRERQQRRHPERRLHMFQASLQPARGAGRGSETPHDAVLLQALHTHDNGRPIRPCDQVVRQAHAHVRRVTASHRQTWVVQVEGRQGLKQGFCSQASNRNLTSCPLISKQSLNRASTCCCTSSVTGTVVGGCSVQHRTTHAFLSDGCAMNTLPVRLDRV